MSSEADLLPLSELLDRHARETLEAGAHDLGGAVSVVDLEGNLIIGESPPAQLVRVGRELSASELKLVADNDQFVIGALFLDERRLGVLVIGPFPAKVKDTTVRSLARHLSRIIDAFILDGSKRAHSSRVHERELERANHELREKNRRLGQIVEKLEEADRVKSNFLATVSHELRTPLTSVIGYSEMLIEGIAGELNEEQREYVHTVMEKGDQLLQLITGILDISRMESGEMRLHRAPFELGEVVGIALSTVAPQARRKKIELTCALPEKLPLLEGDRDRTRQVLLNLVGNAVKFTPESGKIHVGARLLPDSKIIIWVQDSGIGIPAEHLQRIFDPFYQVDNSSTREYGGTGLGLSIVRGLVEAQGGSVTVKSTPGQGATFSFTLPVHTE